MYFCFKKLPGHQARLICQNLRTDKVDSFPKSSDQISLVFVEFRNFFQMTHFPNFFQEEVVYEDLCSFKRPGQDQVVSEASWVMLLLVVQFGARPSIRVAISSKYKSVVCSCLQKYKQHHAVLSCFRRFPSLKCTTLLLSTKIRVPLNSHVRLISWFAT